ncbi:pentatricopeptide repeat-containing protein At5g13770, chloroplastic [Momordica charantia]|uniref:Pentatricopeptide repeat-containing protein At5g13770, chloroplastic n=1 Tax=Momordica charantia TaxID=3673 RepID=A0A6J1CX09_MOMCH|nr:pentatricopeptide repeat-containing protein At5g13770, chloroplastic [Momordica charantia]
MAATASHDCSLPPINSFTKSHLITFPASNLPLLFSLPSSNLRSLHLNSSSCPSPILDQSPIAPPASNPQDSNHLLSGFSSQDPGTEDSIYDCYVKAKKRAGFRPEKSTLRHLIRYLVQSKKWDMIFSVSRDFRDYGVCPDRDTCCRLVSSCVRGRKFKIVRALLEVFETDGDVAAAAFEAAMRGYNKLHMFKSTILVFQRLKSAKIEADSGCYCRVMEAYLKLGDSQRVRELFDEVESRISDLTPFSSKIYGILCESLAKSGRVFESLEFFRDMRKKGIAEDYTIYSSLICTFASIREVKLAEDLFKEAKSKNLLRDPAVFLKLILMYIQQGSLEKALEVVEMMKGSKIGVSDCIFCAIVNGYAARRGYNAAVTVYEKLIGDGCEPGQVTYASAINAYCRVGLYSNAEDIFGEMEEKGFEKCVVAYSSLISMYGKTGRLKDAMRVLAKMKERGCEPNVWIYNILMEMHGKAKNLKQVEKLWKEMKRRKIAPDKVSYTSIISAYVKAKEFETCERYYVEFRMNGGAIDKAMAGIMVSVFSKTSRVDELVKLLREMNLEGTRLDGRLYRSALNALMDAGLQLQAKWLQDHYAAKSGFV